MGISRRSLDGFKREWLCCVDEISGQVKVLLLALSNAREFFLLSKVQEKGQNPRYSYLQETDLKCTTTCRAILFVHTSQRCLSSVNTQFVSGADNFQTKVRPFV